MTFVAWHDSRIFIIFVCDKNFIYQFFKRAISNFFLVSSKGATLFRKMSNFYCILIVFAVYSSCKTLVEILEIH
uniref:Uncharacterized protein n=1 Tax=Lepeophtheirus salmonis TaxID=72036 RepID=A0A0K2TAG8_LEPSM